ncbi:MAG: hypothetical protein PWP24_1797, partial [Clostridiales bacterium]|nr:hypothetical protein [Clostridiales bacterium]
MMFQLYKDSKVADFCVEDTAFLGVRKIAEKVAGDIRLVTGVKPT